MDFSDFNEAVLHSATETEDFAYSLGKTLKGNEIIALFGDLGAGKTTFVRGLARALGVTFGVHSPTFAIVNEYSGAFKIYHFDMYRVTNEDDLYSTGFYDYLNKGIVVIEWSENIISSIPDDAIKIHLSYTEDGNARIIRRM